jgi:hypothetical protein
LQFQNFSFCFHHQADRFTHRGSATCWQQHCPKETRLKRLHIHIGLIRFHHQHRFTSFHPIAWLLEPFHDLPLSHRGTEGRHEDLEGCHPLLQHWD